MLDAQNGRPIGGATVALLDGSITAAAPVTPAPRPGVPGPGASTGIRLSLQQAPVTTDSNGFFTFRRVPALHLYNVEAAVAGYISSGTLTAGTGPFASRADALVTLVPPTAAFIDVTQPLLGTPGTGELLLAPAVPGVDSTPPYVASANPADGADIDVTSAGVPKRPIILTFSECMQADNSFTKVTVATVDFKGRPIPPPGITGNDATVQANGVWSTSTGATCPTTPASGNVLTITPVRDWQAGLTYGVFVAGPAGAAVPSGSALADVAGNSCCRLIPLNVLGTTLPSPTGEVFGEGVPTPTTLLFTTNGGPGVLDGPANVRLAANSADFNQSTATVQWDARADARGYEVFMSLNSGEWQLIARTAPSNDPVTTLLSRSWSFADALNLPGAVGINPAAPAGTAGSLLPASVTNRTPRVSPGFENAARRVVESFVRDLGDDVSAAFGVAAPSGGRVDSADTSPDLSDRFGVDGSQVRIAVATLNSNAIAGSLSSPVNIRDNSGPQTNGAAPAVLPAGSTGLVTCSVGAPCATAAAANPTATSWRGQVIQDLFSGTTFGPDGAPDTILIGLSEPLRAASATCTTVADCAAKYVLKDSTTGTPSRLQAINIVSATYDEDTNGDGILQPIEDSNGNGVLDTGSNVDRSDDTIKGNDFGNAYVWLRIAPVTTGGPVDIRAGDYVEITGVQDIAENNNRPVDPTLAQNKLADITQPQLLSATKTDGTATTAGTITINFSEPLAAPFAFTLTVAGVVCSGSYEQTPDFVEGASSVTLSEIADAEAACKTARLAGDGTAGSDVLKIPATVKDRAGNTINAARDALIFNAGAFIVTSALATLPAAPAPQLSSATANVDGITFDSTVVLTFTQRLGSIVRTSVDVTTRGGLTHCTFDNGGLVFPTDTDFVPGDRAVTVQLIPGPAASPTEHCTFREIAVGVPRVIAGDFIALGDLVNGVIVPPFAKATDGATPLSSAADHAVRNAGNTAYVVNNDSTL